MAEGAQNSIAYAPESNPPIHHLENSPDEHERPFTSPPPTRETMSILHQRPQKCELRRLLKHTYPELKNVDSLVEEELADILNMNTDTGYQSEFQSRCWLFENHEINSVDIHDQKLQKKEFQEGDIKRTTCMFEQPTSNSYNEDNKPQLNKSEEGTSEQSIKLDVKATRRMFETQSMASQNPCSPRKNIVCEEESRSHQIPKSNFETDGKETSDLHHNSLTNDLIDTNEVFVSISKSKQVFETVSHDKENISPTNDNFSQEQELLKANVRNRAQMFESTPLNKINQQTKEESETILKNTQETLVSLCNFSIMHSDGTILEANENGNVKKARYNFIQEDKRPEIQDEEIVTGSIKNITLQMLPGTNLNPIVTFLKEDSQGNVEIQKIDVPIHQLPFTQDKECRTANVVQITEDLLSQEKSLRKGVLIQDGAKGMREITVYALFIHSEESTGVMEFGKIGFRSIPSSLRNVPESENCDLKTDISLSESSSVVDTNKTSNVPLFQSCIEKGDLNRLKCLQETSSDVDIDASTGESEKTSEIIPGKVNNIKALFTTNIDDTSMQSDEKKSKVLPKESLANNENDNAEATNQSCPDTGDNLKKERSLQNQDIMDDGVVLQAELAGVVEDDELVNLQTPIMNLPQATIEAKALQQIVPAKHASQTNQTQQICDSGSMTLEFTPVKNNDNVSENDELSQFSKTEMEESKEDVMRGSIQAALDSLGKSNFNITKGDFRAAMIYRNSGKGFAGHKKTDEVMMNQMNQPSDRTKENKSATFSPAPQAEKEALKSPEGTGTSPCERPFENKPVTCSPMPVSVETPAKNRKTPVGPKPAIPPKPDHLKIKPKPLGSETDSERLNKCQVPPTSSKPPAEQTNESSTSKQCLSHENALCKRVQHTDAYEHEPSDTSVSNSKSPKKLNGVEVVEETPKSSPESTVNESSTGFHATLQNFGVKPSGSVPPVKPKRIKMAKENVKNSDNTISNSTTLETETAQGTIPPHNNDSSGETYKTDTNNREKRNDKSDDQVSGVVRREKKIRGETEDERRQRLSVHMDEIMKGNVSAVMEIFDKLKKQEELKNILSKVEEIEEDTNKVDVSSLKNIFESVPDWVVPREKKIKPKIVTPEHTGAPSEPEMMSSMEVAFEDLEKAGAEIIRLKDQTLARLMDIEEAIKKALYSVSTLKSDSDIVGLSGLFRESMVVVQGSPPSGNIRKISIGSSKSSKAQNQIGKRVSGQSTTHKRPELFIPTTKPRSASPASPSFISIQSAARKPTESPSPQISALKEEPKEETKLQCCCSVPSDRRQCSVTKEAPSSPANPQRQVSVLEVQTRPEEERVIRTKTISENYERTDCFGNKFYSSKTSTIVTTQPETRTTSKKLIVSSPATTEIVTYPRINTPFIREDRPPL